MSKHNNQHKKNQIIKELALLMPAFTFIFESITKHTTAEDRETRDYELAKRISRTIATRLLAYQNIQKDALEKWKKVESELGEAEYNTFLLGLSLLARHSEVKRKMVYLGLDTDIVELQDLCFEFYTTDAINNTSNYADLVCERMGI